MIENLLNLSITPAFGELNDTFYLNVRVDFVWISD